MNRWHRLGAVLIVASSHVAIGCRAEGRPAADSAQPAVDSAAPVTQASEAAPPQRRDSVTAAARADCDEVVASWQRIYDVRVNMTSDTTFDVPSAAADSTRVVGCRVVAEDSVGVPPSDTARLKRDGPARSSYWTRSDDAGWTHLASAPAGGSDGSATTYQRALVRCYVEEGSTAVDTSAAKGGRPPWFRQTTSCWNHGRMYRVGDSVPPSGGE